jgi:hypothetical protein
MVYAAVNSNTESFLDYPNNILGELLVEFKNGAEYIYKNIPFEIMMLIATASSIGQSFNRAIVNGGYDFEKI